MREIDKKLIEAIKDEKPIEEIKKLIDDGADVNVKIDYKYYEPSSTIGLEKEQTKYIYLIEYILENLFEEILEYEEEKRLKIPDKELESEILLDILIYIELEKHISKILYYLQLLKMISQNKNFQPDENVLEKLVKCEIAIVLKPIILITIQKLDMVKNKAILIDAIIQNVHFEVIRLMIESGININFIDKYGLNPLIYAFIKDRSKIIEIFKEYNEFDKKTLEKIAKKFLITLFKRNILPIPLLNENPREIVSNLIFNANAYGLNVKNILDDEKIIYLLFDLRLVKDLIDRNILEVNHKINNKTLLELALQKQKSKIIKFLIQKGANVNIVLSNGKTLLETAELLGNQELINLIKSSPTYKPFDHNPKKLVEILTNFRKDTPIKYSTHSWDFDFKKEYGNFENYIKAVKNQWNEMEKELKNLAPNIYRKIELFLFSKNQNEVWSSVEGDKLAIGWSNLEGLEKWCNEGKNPFNFELTKKYRVEGKTLSTFDNVINVFKREIQIRNENNHLEEIISDFEELIYEKDDNFELEYEKLKGKTFYTDVEVFKKVLDKIFSEMLKRKEYPKILIKAKNENEKYFDLYITQIGSFSNLSAKEMLEKVKGGDFADIKNNLRNLCDWSIENKDANNQTYRVNYLISKPVDRIEKINNDIEGFTHILRFYK